MTTNVSRRQHKYSLIYMEMLQLLSNFPPNLVITWFNTEARLLLDAAGGLILSSDNPLEFHPEIWSLLPTFLKNIYRLAKALNNFPFHNLQNDFYQERSFTISFCSTFDSAFVASATILLPKSELLINLETSDLTTNLFSFIFSSRT